MPEVIHLSHNHVTVISHVSVSARTTFEKTFFIAWSPAKKWQHGLCRKSAQEMNLDNPRHFMKQCLIVKLFHRQILKAILKKSYTVR